MGKIRKVLITGGTGRIGSVLVRELLNHGYSVIFTTRKIQNGYNFIKENNLPKKKCTPVEVDFSENDPISKIYSQLEVMPDAIIHNARSLDTLKINSNGRIDTNQFQSEFFNGVTFPYELTYKLLANNAPIKDVIFISSMYGVVAPTPRLYDNFHLQSPINYGVVKAAQIHLSKELAVRLANRGIRVNTISYGGVEGRVDEEFKKRYSELTPLGEMLSDTDLFPPVKYILDNPDLKMTGENLKVDGGWTIW